MNVVYFVRTRVPMYLISHLPSQTILHNFSIIRFLSYSLLFHSPVLFLDVQLLTSSSMLFHFSCLNHCCFIFPVIFLLFHSSCHILVVSFLILYSCCFIPLVLFLDASFLLSCSLVLHSSVLFLGASFLLSCSLVLLSFCPFHWCFIPSVLFLDVSFILSYSLILHSLCPNPCCFIPPVLFLDASLLLCSIPCCFIPPVLFLNASFLLCYIPCCFIPPVLFLRLVFDDSILMSVLLFPEMFFCWSLDLLAQTRVNYTHVVMDTGYLICPVYVRPN